MTLKKTMSAILAVSMLAASPAVLAEESTNDIMLISENPVTSRVSSFYDKAELYGTANVEEGWFYIATENGDVMLNIDENTIFVDGNGYRISVEEIENGTSIKVIASYAQTKSLPPQSYAYVVMTADGDGGFPIYVDVEKVTKDDSQNLVFSSKDGNYDIVYGEGVTEVKPFATKNIVKADDIAEGSRILVFADVMTMSIPALVPADKIVILPELQEKSDETDVERVTINGEELLTDVASFIKKDGIVLLPVRAVCEKIGLEVQWKENLSAISVGTVPMGATFNIGINSYTKAKMAAQTLSVAPIAENGRTYVPVDFFTEILEGTVTTENGTLNINF